jgi:hypothetical protein
MGPKGKKGVQLLTTSSAMRAMFVLQTQTSDQIGMAPPSGRRHASIPPSGLNASQLNPIVYCIVQPKALWDTLTLRWT